MLLLIERKVERIVWKNNRENSLVYWWIYMVKKQQQHFFAVVYWKTYLNMICIAQCQNPMRDNHPHWERERIVGKWYRTQNHAPRSKYFCSDNTQYAIKQAGASKHSDNMRWCECITKSTPSVILHSFFFVIDYSLFKSQQLRAVSRKKSMSMLAVDKYRYKDCMKPVSL